MVAILTALLTSSSIRFLNLAILCLLFSLLSAFVDFLLLSFLFFFFVFHRWLDLQIVQLFLVQDPVV